ncbi:unnamed protein product [Peronospora effusa]|nr:unnamed protein product [Peronospora effusa]
MSLHPTFYVGRLKAYLPADLPLNIPRSSVPARNPTSLDDDVNDDWDQVLPERVQTRSAGALRTQSSQVDAPDYENRRSSPEAFRRDAPPPLVDASGVRRWIVDQIVDHEDHKPQAPSNNSAPMKKRVEKHYRVRWLGYYPAEDTWEPSSTLSQDVTDVVEDYESRRKTVIPTDADGSIPDLASRNAREQRYRDDLPSDSDTETYHEAREHMDDTVDDLGYVNAVGDRKDAFSLAVARTPGAPKGFSHNGRSMDEYGRACLAHTLSRPIPAGPVAICPRCTLDIPHECGRKKGDTRHKSYDRCAGAGLQ